MSKSVSLLLVLLFTIASCVVAAKPALSTAVIAENSWVSKASMQVARSGLGVAVVNGKIYAIGGSTLQGSPPYTGGIVGTNEEYDPTTNTWVFKTPMPTPRTDFGIAVYNNKIYCIGGEKICKDESENPYSGINEVYDPATDTWETKASMPTFRSGVKATLVYNEIYLIGGADNGSSLIKPKFNEVYDPETDSWTSRTSMSTSTEDFASAVFGNKIYVIGGFSKFSSSELNQIYDVESDSWSYGAPIPFDLIVSAAACVTTDIQAPARIYVFGEMWNIGEAHKYSSLIYDPKNYSWTVGVDIPTDRNSFGVAIVNDIIYVIGGGTAYPTGINFYGSATLTKYATNERYMPIGYGTIAPLVQLISPQNQMYNTSGVSLVFTVNKPASWMGYSLDGQDSVTVTENVTLTGLSSGLHNVTVYAKDEFGNVGASETVCFTLAEEPFPVAPVAAASIATVAIIVVGLLFYFRKHKR